MRLETKITMRSVYPNCDPPAKSVAQFPGSMYPTEIKNPGPANASSRLQNPNVLYTGMELCTSSKLIPYRAICVWYRGKDSGQGQKSDIKTSPEDATRIGAIWRPLLTECKHLFFCGILFESIQLLDCTL